MMDGRLEWYVRLTLGKGTNGPPSVSIPIDIVYKKHSWHGYWAVVELDCRTGMNFLRDLCPYHPLRPHIWFYRRSPGYQRMVREIAARKGLKLYYSKHYAMRVAFEREWEMQRGLRKESIWQE